jgi:hypothetical protein
MSLTASKYTAATGAIALVAGIVITATQPDTDEPGEALFTRREVAGKLLLFGGILTALGGVIGMAAFGPTSPAPRPSASP